MLLLLLLYVQITATVSSLSCAVGSLHKKRKKLDPPFFAVEYPCSCR